MAATPDKRKDSIVERMAEALIHAQIAEHLRNCTEDMHSTVCDEYRAVLAAWEAER